MFALTVSILAAVYIFGPDLLTRFILGFVVPRRNIQQSRSEEITRATLVAVIPLLLVVAWVTTQQVVHWRGSLPDIETFFAGIYSDKGFDENRAAFYRSFAVVAGINWALFWRLYTLLIVGAISFALVVFNYGRIWHSQFCRRHPLLRTCIATLVVPRVSEWHVLLTSFALPDEDTAIRADILTKSGIMYRGNLRDPVLGADGALRGVLLSEPERFRLDEYRKAREAGGDPDREEFWREIPSKTFLMLEGDIANINLRHYDPNEDHELLSQISSLLNKAITAAGGKPTRDS